MRNGGRFDGISMADLKQGYTETEEYYTCLFCGETAEKGIVYREGHRLLLAEKYLRRHIETAHGSVFASLLNLDKKHTGLTEHQKNLLRLFYAGKSDGAIQDELGIGSVSTIRNHRFSLKEKERQARIFLTLMELLAEREAMRGRAADEEETVLRKYFPAGPAGPLRTTAIRNKHRPVVLTAVAQRIMPGRDYTEKEINGVLKEVNADYVTLRRYLVDYGFLDRTADGRRYRRNQAEREGRRKMDRREELKRQYKEMKTEAGVYQIKNMVNQKVFVASTPNLKSLNRLEMMLGMGGHVNKELQKEWNEYGKENFSIEVLEVLTEKEDEYYNAREALKELEAKWLTKLQPYGEKGYNRQKPTRG